MTTRNDSHVLCAAVDWGTSSFRLWTLGHDGRVLEERRSGQGMSTLEPADYSDVLERHLGDLGLTGDVPVVICGMAGSAQGWQEAVYVDLPASLSGLPGCADPVASTQRDVRILPGLAQRDEASPDVMRGEETLLLGALQGDGRPGDAFSGTICLPGTHAKWVTIRDGTVTRFHTAMTGEIFALLAHESTLAHFIDRSQNTDVDEPAFALAVREAIEAPECILNALFSVRAGPLLGTARAEQMPARLSGLLIGLEIAGMRESAEGRLTLISDGALAQSYSAAFRAAGLAFRVWDAGAMVRAGLYFAARSLWPERLQYLEGQA